MMGDFRMFWVIKQQLIFKSACECNFTSKLQYAIIITYKVQALMHFSFKFQVKNKEMK